MDAFWRHPTRAEQLPGEAIPTTATRAGTAIRTLAQSFTRPGSHRARRPCLARGITGLEHSRDPSRVRKPRSGERTRRCSGDGPRIRINYVAPVALQV